MTWKNALAQGQELVFVTSSTTGKPHANVVISMGFVDGKLLIADCEMVRSAKNAKADPNVCVVTTKKGYYRMKGRASLYTSGKYFETAVKRTGPKYKVKHAIVIGIREVFDLNEMKKVQL